MSASCKVTWWLAGGLHAHVTYPDGDWERRVWSAEKWWEIDALVRELETTYGKTNVWVNAGAAA